MGIFCITNSEPKANVDLAKTLKIPLVEITSSRDFVHLFKRLAVLKHTMPNNAKLVSLNYLRLRM